MKVCDALSRFLEDELAPATGLPATEILAALENLVQEFAQRNRNLLGKRDRLQEQVDAYHRERRDMPFDVAGHEAHLKSIGYIVDAPERFGIDVHGSDDEIARIAGPQLVVPASNARYALNAANARWGSLYDALYGTDAVGGERNTADYDPVRGRAVILRARQFLDEIAPLTRATHGAASGYVVQDGRLRVHLDGGIATLADECVFAGYRGDPQEPSAILLRHHGLHVEICIDRQHEIGRTDPAGVADLLLESAISTIVDFEDSVAAVDADDKVGIYRTWLGLARGDLAATFTKDGKPVSRFLQPDRDYVSPNGGSLSLPGRALLLARNVGLHMYTDAATAGGHPIPEGLLDGLITAAISTIDLSGKGRFRNSRTGSVYVVKPKLHGPEEVEFTSHTLARVEKLLDLPPNTIKLGLMDEERRTSVNLAACIAAARQRIFFINTGFLDRTGDEIHTAMERGPMVRKDAIKTCPWISAYERRNVAIGLAAGFSGRAQIGKGMWAAPDRMADMLQQKAAQLEAGATTAWVPSPTAATLHALHYHKVDVYGRHAALAHGDVPETADLLMPPLQAGGPLPAAEIRNELDNNAQGILGYVVRWIDQGVGCSKVPDINDIGLMEDRATLRISSQHIANWLRHGIVSEDEVRETLQRMAKVVDRQNAGDPAYTPMAPAYDGCAFQAACELVFQGAEQPNGYTEFILHKWRRVAKTGVAR